MVDYYAILSRAVRSPGVGDAQARHDLYARAQDMLGTQLRERHPPPSRAEVGAQQAALQDAIERIEAEFAAEDYGDAFVAGDRMSGQTDDYPADTSLAGRLSSTLRARPLVWVVVAVAVAALGAGIYAFRSSSPGKPTATARAPASQSSRAPEAASRPAAPRESPLRVLNPRPARDPNATIAVVEDVAPGVDGGSTDAGLPYFYRRQPVFYRTTHPVGTVIVEKSQRFLYLIQPNSVALRYGIAVGIPCGDLAGLRRVAAKAEWPPWDPPQDLVERRVVKAGVLPGGPGNPLGARVFDLDDKVSRIHGTNAPKTIGNAVALGCLRMVNDDIVDLFNRVPIGTRVILSD